jgi:hypothetical protein
MNEAKLLPPFQKKKIVIVIVSDTSEIPEVQNRLEPNLQV